MNQKLKQLIHQKKMAERHQKALEQQQSFRNRANNDQLHNQELVLSIANTNDMFDSPALNNNRQFIIKKLLSTKINKRSKARINLMDYAIKNKIRIMGIVADIKIEAGHHPALLIDKPSIYMDDVNQQVDNHIWLFVNRIVSRSSDVKPNQAIAIGDYLDITSEVKPYLGKTNDHIKGYRYGLGNTKINACGQFVRTRKNSLVLNTIYNRYNDWVVKFVNLPQNHNNNHVQFMTQPSRYPSYYERLNIPKAQTIQQNRQQHRINQQKAKQLKMPWKRKGNRKYE